MTLNSSGEMVAAKSGVLSCPPHVLVAEAASLREALSWLQSKGLKDVLLEPDLQLLVHE